MLQPSTFEATERTHTVPGMAADKAMSGWSKKLHLTLPAQDHTRNEGLIVELPLSAAEVCQRDRCMMFTWARPRGACKTQCLLLGEHPV
jgi:hypothetical protein